MGNNIRSYGVGEILEVIELESEVGPPKTSFRKLRLQPASTSRNKWMLLGIAVVGITFLTKAFWSGLVYREEWIVGACGLMGWLFGIKRAFGDSTLQRLSGRTVAAFGALLWIVLLAAPFHPKIANGLAMHWLFRSGCQVNSGMSVLGENYLDVYSQPISDLSISCVDGQVPKRVLWDLDLKLLNINLAVSSTSKIDSGAIRNIAQVSPSRPGFISLSTEPLNQLSDGDLLAMTQAGLVVSSFKLTSGVAANRAVKDYLLSPNIKPLMNASGENLTSEDLAVLEEVSAVKGKFRFLALSDCQIDDQTAASIAKSAASVFLNSIKQDSAGTPWRLTSAELDALIKHKVPALNLNVTSLTKDQCAGLSGNSALLLINVPELDSESVELLSMTSLRGVGLDFLSEEAAQSMIRNRITWMLSVNNTNADYATLLRLVQLPTLKSFYLQSRSQFTPAQQENLEK